MFNGRSEVLIALVHCSDRLRSSWKYWSRTLLISCSFRSLVFSVPGS